MLYESVPFSGSDALTLHVPEVFTASVVGPENPEIVGGRFPVVPSKYAVQYPLPAQIEFVSARHARKVHIAGLPGLVREQTLHPSFHALQFAGGVKFATGH
jgi:hypothetical protein